MTGEPKILANIIRTPDGTILQSFHRHDFKTHEDTVTKQIYGVDGGTAYLKRIGGICEDLSVYSDDPHELIREWFSWGSYGKTGKEELRFIKLKDMEDDHVQAVMDLPYVLPHIRKVMKDELDYRKQVG